MAVLAEPWKCGLGCALGAGTIEYAIAEDRLTQFGDLWEPDEPDPTLERCSHRQTDRLTFGRTGETQVWRRMEGKPSARNSAWTDTKTDGHGWMDGRTGRADRSSARGGSCFPCLSTFFLSSIFFHGFLFLMHLQSLKCTPRLPE
jgi:hypothetical protein